MFDKSLPLKTYLHNIALSIYKAIDTIDYIEFKHFCLIVIDIYIFMTYQRIASESKIIYKNKCRRGKEKMLWESVGFFLGFFLFFFF